MCYRSKPLYKIGNILHANSMDEIAVPRSRFIPKNKLYDLLRPILMAWNKSVYDDAHRVRSSVIVLDTNNPYTLVWIQGYLIRKRNQ